MGGVGAEPIIGEKAPPLLVLLLTEPLCCRRGDPAGEACSEPRLLLALASMLLNSGAMPSSDTGAEPIARWCW